MLADFPGIFKNFVFEFQGVPMRFRICIGNNSRHLPNDILK